MQQCHQQTEKVSERPTIQLDPVRILSSMLIMVCFEKICSHTKVVVLSPVRRSAQTCDEVASTLIGDLKTQIKEKENVFFDMEAYLPKKNGSVRFFFHTLKFNLAKFHFGVLYFCHLRLYLNLVLGNVNVTLLSNQAKYVSGLHLELRGTRSWSEDQLFSVPLDLPTRTNMKSLSFT